MMHRGLSDEYKSVYLALGEVVQTRRAKGISPPRVAVISDIGKDLDDLTALVVLAELHRLQVIELVGVVTNLHPAAKRARLARGALDKMSLRDIPVGIGSQGIPPEDEASKIHKENHYEFGYCDFLAAENDRIEDGSSLLHNIFSNAIKDKCKVKLLLISSLMDIAEFSSKFPGLLTKDSLDHVHIQGAYSVDPQTNYTTPLKAGANNKYHFKAATVWHDFMNLNDIPSTVWGKAAAFATPISVDFFQELSKDGHDIGRYLKRIHWHQERHFYTSCGHQDTRFASFMNEEWYLINKTSWTPSSSYKRDVVGNYLLNPEGKQIRTNHPASADEAFALLDKCTLYDALAALGVAGDDVVKKLGVVNEETVKWEILHRVVGIERIPGVEGDLEKNLKAVEESPAIPGVNGRKMATAIKALMKGGLLFAK
ncbi:hypothetical protein B0O99DRAFT_694240 [Bisporella sp. PMI_857]|nr:hypothetical protein B0O99DRAFT_694240 [Bisporella sp. PMI_857]